MPEREAFSHRIARTWQWCREGSNIRFTNGRRGQPPLAGGKANSGRPAWLGWARRAMVGTCPIMNYQISFFRAARLIDHAFPVI